MSPGQLFDALEVMALLSDQARRRTSSENVADVLEALEKLPESKNEHTDRERLKRICGIIARLNTDQGLSISALAGLQRMAKAALDGSNLDAGEFAESPLEADNKKLRRLLAFSYSGTNLYTDDGELSDARSPMIDFVRDSVIDIERSIHQRGMDILVHAQSQCKHEDGPNGYCPKCMKVQ